MAARPELIDQMIRLDALKYKKWRKSWRPSTRRLAQFHLGRTAGIIDTLRALGYDDLLDEALSNASEVEVTFNALDRWFGRQIRRSL